MATTKQQLIDLRTEMYTHAFNFEVELDKKIEIEVKKLSPLKQNWIKQNKSKTHHFDHHPGVFELRKKIYGKYIDLAAFYPWSHQFTDDFLQYVRGEVYEYMGETGLIAIQIEPSLSDPSKKAIRMVSEMNLYHLDDYIMTLINFTDMREAQKAA